DGTNFLAVYTDQATLKGRFVSAAGVLGNEVTLVTASGFVIEEAGAVAFNGTNYLVTFPHALTTTSPTDAFAQLVSTAGAPVGGLINLASGGYELPVGAVASG